MRVIIFIFLIIVIGACLRFTSLGRYSFQFDEVASLMDGGIGEAFVLSRDFPTYRPLYGYNLLLRAWKIPGNGEAALRMFPALAGVCAIPAVYVLARKLFDRRTALIAALLFSLSPFQVHYSQELTVYALSVFLGILSYYFFVRVIERPVFVDCAGLVLCNLINVYCNHLAILVLITQIICLGIYWRSVRQHPLPAVLTLVIQVLLLLPWLYIMLRQFSFMLDYTRESRQVSFFLRRVTVWNLMYTVKNFVSGYYAGGMGRNVLFVVTGTVSCFSIYRLLKTDFRKGLMLATWFIFPSVFLFFFSRYVVLYADRYCITGSIALCLLFAHGIASVHRRWAAGILVLVACAGVFSLQRYYANAMSVPARERGGVNSRKDFKGAAGYLAVRSSPGDVFVHVNEVSSLPLYYYYGRASGTGGRIFLKDAVLLFDNWFFKHRTEPRAIIEETVPHRLSVYLFGGPGAFDPQFIVRSHRVWLVYSSWDEWDARPWFTVLSENLIRDYELAETKDYDGISLSLFVRKDRRI